jgi:hypothetical protein
MRRTKERRIGTIGTALRVVVGIGLLYFALVDDWDSWGLAWHDLVLGLAVFPGTMLALGLAARRFAGGPVRFTGPLGLALNTAVIVTLATIDYTASAAGLFYGLTLLVSAWRAQPGCEATVLSNWILRRDDQIGCPTFTPIDALEAQLRAHGNRGHRAARTETT